MELTKDFEALIHLIARAFGRASGNEAPEVHADVVVEHAKAIAAEDAAKSGNAAAIEAQKQVIEEQQPVLPAGDQVQQTAAQ